MDTSDLATLTEPSEATLAFGFIRTMAPDDQVRHIQSMVATADLCSEVPDDLRASFDRLRRIFAYGLFYYDTFTAVYDLTWLTMEQALRERFVTYYEGHIPLVSSKLGQEKVLDVDNFQQVQAAFSRGGPCAKDGWTVKVSTTGAPLEGLRPFRGSLVQLQRWARQEGLFRGQRNAKLEVIYRHFRNWAAHPHRHLVMPMDAAGAIHDLAEIINNLWGHPTPGGRLYPSPLRRSARIVGWTPVATGSRVEMLPDHLATWSEPEADWQFVVVLAAEQDSSLMEFDPRYEMTDLPSQLIWGPGSRAETLAWLRSNEVPGDEVTYQDRVFAVRRTANQTYLPRRPGVALGLSEERRAGTWYLIRADAPLAAFSHVRHKGILADCQQGDAMEGCQVEELYEGSWAGLEGCLRSLSLPTSPEDSAQIWLPGWQAKYAPDVGHD